LEKTSSLKSSSRGKVASPRVELPSILIPHKNNGAKVKFQSPDETVVDVVGDVSAACKVPWVKASETPTVNNVR